MEIHPVINGVSPHEVKSHLHICDIFVVTFGIRVSCLGFSKTPHVDSLYRFRKSVVNKFKTNICIKKIKPFEIK